MTEFMFEWIIQQQQQKKIYKIVNFLKTIICQIHNCFTSNSKIFKYLKLVSIFLLFGLCAVENPLALKP